MQAPRVRMKLVLVSSLALLATGCGSRPVRGEGHLVPINLPAKRSAAATPDESARHPHGLQRAASPKESTPR